MSNFWDYSAYFKFTNDHNLYYVEVTKKQDIGVL